MATTLSHEKMRWSTMSERQLRTRLNKITVAEKLENYLLVARERGYRSLFEAALDRASMLEYYNLMSRYSGTWGNRGGRAHSQPRSRDIVDHRVRPEVFSWKQPEPEVKEAKKPIRFIRIGGKS